MVFTKRTIFPFLIKVRPSLRDSAFSLRFPAENFRTAKFSAGKTLRKRRDGRKRDSEGENCDRRSACATRKRTVREPLFMPYPGMRPLSSPAVVKALLLPLHCICGLFCPYPRPPVLLLFRQPTILSLSCHPPQNQHRRINCMKARARFLFPNCIFAKNNIMAITIKNIPVLEGATAEDFVRSADKNAAKVTPRLSVEAKKRLRKVLEKSRSFRFN